MSGDDETRLPAGLPGAGPRQAMSLPHNIRPEQMVGPETAGTRWKRFQPLKKLQRMFRRKSKTKDDEEEYPDAPKSFSASQLPPAGQRRSSRRDSPPLQSRLSMSHDSIFQSEGGGAQGAEMGSALSIPSVPGASGQLTAELRGVLLKRRADDSDDDPGLPHSPASPSTPPAASRHQTELKGQSGKSGGSCSDGSLLSMYSSGTCTDDDIFGPLSKHPSRASLGRDPDGLELETTAALSHSAAKHRIAVRPRRNHGVPRQRRSRAGPPTGPAATGLPPTVEEESPPSTPTARPAAPARPAAASPGQLMADRPRRAPSASPSRSQSIRTGSPEGATAAASIPVRPTQVKRSKSSVADGRIRDVSPRKFWSRDPPAAAAVAAESEDRRAEKGENFFSRIFGSRRSGRKKKDERSLSPETAATDPVPVPARRPPVPRHRSQFGGGDHRGSPASALHADIIRLPPSEATRAAEMAEPQPAEFPRATEPQPTEFPRPTEQPRSTEIPRGAEIPKSVDLIRSAEAPRSADFARPTEPVRPVSEFPRPTEPVRMTSEVPRPPPEALRRGPAFLADVRAEVAALAAGGDRGSDTVTVSPQVVRRHRASAAPAVGRSAAAGSDSPHTRPRLVGLTAYQQRVAHLQRSPSPETAPSPAARRSFSCEDVSEEETGSRPCSGMALGSVLSLIKSTTAGERQQPAHEDGGQAQQPARGGGEEPEAALNVPPRSAGRRESSGSPGAGPKSLDSSLLSGAVAEPPLSQPPPKASSAESVQSGGQERTPRGSSDQQLPEFLRVQLHRVEGRQRDSVPPASSASASTPQRVSAPLQSPTDESRPLAPERRDSGRDSSEREAASSSAASDESPPQLRRPVPAPRSGSPDLPRRPSQVRSRGSASSGGSGDAEPVVLRAKPAPSSEDSELLKVFKRRSLKSRDSEELPASVAMELGSPGSRHRVGDGGQRTGRGGDGDEKENEQPREETEETVVCVSVPASPPRRPLSSEDSEPRRVSVTRRDSEATRRPSAQDEESSRPPGWLKQIRERREQREQREQKHLRNPTQKELLIESEAGQVGRAGGPSRSSRVLEMANTFQKLQTT